MQEKLGNLADAGINSTARRYGDGASLLDKTFRLYMRGETTDALCEANFSLIDGGSPQHMGVFCKKAYKRSLLLRKSTIHSVA